MTTDETPPASHKRRPRYRGTHPRTYGEKYKEHDPEKYSEDVRHIISRGQTPAGMHRPICVDEIMTVLQPKPGDVMFDATLGYGGHARELLSRIHPGGKLYAVDVDPIELVKTEQRLRGEGYDADVLVIRRMNFAGIAQLLPEVPHGFAGICADLGMSSMQLDNPERGFSYKLDGPLDLRLNPNKAKPAASLLQSLSVEELAEMLTENADEPHAELIAKTISTAPAAITTTKALAEAVRMALAGLHLQQLELAEEVKKSCQRTFMALRIAVNDEFGALDRFLEVMPWCMKPGAHAAILAFHSGEDRRVKKAFQRGLRSGIYCAVAPAPLRPSPKEQFENPRSSGAKLRWAERSEVSCW
jgi:16S rRNA (cytosine1402-N4)-methyltransferase